MCEGLHQFFSVSVSLFFFYFNFFDQFWITFNFRKEDAKKYSRNVMQSGPLWIYLGWAWRAAVMTREFIAGVWTRRKSCQNIGFYCWQSVPESSSPKPIFGVGVDNCPILWSLLIYDNGGGCTRALDPSRKCHVSWSFLVSKTSYKNDLHPEILPAVRIYLSKAVNLCPIPGPFSLLTLDPRNHIVYTQG